MGELATELVYLHLEIPEPDFETVVVQLELLGLGSPRVQHSLQFLRLFVVPLNKSSHLLFQHPVHAGVLDRCVGN